MKNPEWLMMTRSSIINSKTCSQIVKTKNKIKIGKHGKWTLLFTNKDKNRVERTWDNFLEMFDPETYLVR